MVAWESLDALSHQLELCKIGSDSRVAVLLASDVDSERVSLIRAAMARTGAEAIEVRPVASEYELASDGLLAAMVGEATVVVTTTSTRALDVLLGDERQVLHLADVEPENFPPNAGLRRRVDALAHNLSDATLLRVSDAHGTDLQITLAGADIDADHGLIDANRRVASFPAGWVRAVPARGTVEGQLVIMPGDANLQTARLINSPVVLQITNDHVSEIRGDSPDADVIRALLEYPLQASAYGAAEICVGMNPAGQSTAPFDTRLLDPIVSRLLAGVISLSVGENLLADRPCSQTITLVLPGRNLQIDGLPVLSAGQLEGDFAPDVYEL